jgi:hypothetical protein
MDRKEFNELIIKKGFKTGDSVLLIHSANGYEEKAVLTEDHLSVGLLNDKTRTVKWTIDYASLSGLTYHYIGKTVPFRDIMAWVPETEKEKECVAKIRKDLEEGTYKYIS